MAGNVYLRTNRFEVKLEAITFKTKDIVTLCKMDFLFPQGKVWDRPPIVGLDIMRHPRDPLILLVLLCFGVGCVILRFAAGEALPAPIHNFLADKRINFVGFGVPEKKDLFPFKALGLRKSKVDIGYIAANVLKDPKCKRWELAELARKILGIKRMIGLTESSSFERHEQIKCAICQLFITTLVAMALLRAKDKKKLDESPIKRSLMKNFNSLHLLAEGLFKMPKGRKKNRKPQADEEDESIRVHVEELEDMLADNVFVGANIYKGYTEDDSSGADAKDEIFNVGGKGTDFVSGAMYDRDAKGNSRDNSGEEACSTTKKPLKGILKCPSTGLQNYKLSPPDEESPPSTSDDQMAEKSRRLKRANSKGCNVSFKCH